MNTITFGCSTLKKVCYFYTQNQPQEVAVIKGLLSAVFLRPFKARLQKGDVHYAKNQIHNKKGLGQGKICMGQSIKNERIRNCMNNVKLIKIGDAIRKIQQEYNCIANLVL